MARFAVTAVFEVGPGRVPRGADVLDRISIPDIATHRFSYCDGTTLTVVVDWTAVSEGAARESAVSGIRLVWQQLTDRDPGAPLSVRIRTLTPPPPKVVAGAARGRAWHVEGLPPIELFEEPRLRWPDGQGPDDGGPDDGGLAGVREPRRPKPGPGHLSAALDEPGPTV